MSLWNDIRKASNEGWRKMTMSDKVKIAVRLLCSCGSGLAFGVLARKYIESENPGMLETTAVVTTAIGAAWATGDMTYNAWCNVIDNFDQLKREYDDIKREYNELGDEFEREEEVG